MSFRPPAPDQRELGEVQAARDLDQDTLNRYRRPVQGVLGQVAGFGVAPHLSECPIDVVRDLPHVRVVVAEPAAPLLAEIVGEIMAGAGIAARYQVPAPIAGQGAQGGGTRGRWLLLLN